MTARQVGLTPLLQKKKGKIQIYLFMSHPHCRSHFVVRFTYQVPPSAVPARRGGLKSDWSDRRDGWKRRRTLWAAWLLMPVHKAGTGACVCAWGGTELGRLNGRKAQSHFLFLPLLLDPWQSQGLKSASYKMGHPFNKKLCHK